MNHHHPPPMCRPFLCGCGALADLEMAMHASTPVLGNVVVRLGAEAARLVEVKGRDGGASERERPP